MSCSRLPRFWILLLSVALPVHADVTLDSKPTGIYLHVEGPTLIAGNTPIAVNVWPHGDYLLSVQWSGFAAAKARLRRTRQDEILLSPPSTAFALLAPPGYTYLRRDEVGHGLILLSAGAAGALGTYVKSTELDDAQSDVALATAAYESAVSEEAIEATRLALQSATDKERDKKEVRALWAGYLGVVWIGSGLEAWLWTPKPTLQKTSDEGYLLSVPRVGAGQACWRSMAFPGAGQRYLGRDRAGRLFELGVLSLGAGAIIAHDIFLDAERDQANAQRRYDAAETEAEIRQQLVALEGAAEEADDLNFLRWTMLGLTGGAYLWNVIDATLSGGGAAQHYDARLLSIAPSPSGVEVAVSWRFR